MALRSRAGMAAEQGVSWVPIRGRKVPLRDLRCAVIVVLIAPSCCRKDR